MPDWWWGNPVVVVMDEFQALIVGFFVVGHAIWIRWHDRREQRRRDE